MKNLKKNLKKITTMFMLALAIITTMPVNVLAELSSGSTGTVTGQTTTVTINGVESGNDKVKATAYRIIDVIVDDNAHQPKAPVYVWAQNVGEWMLTNHPDLIKTKTSGSTTTNVTYTEGGVTRYAVAEKFCSSGSTCISSASVDTLYGELAAAIKSGSLSVTSFGPFDSSNDGAISMDLGLGNYLVLINNGLNIYKPAAVNVVPEYKKTSEEGVTPEVYEWVVASGSIDVESKSSPVDIDKEVVVDGEGANETTVSVGDTVTYRITVDVPNYPSNATYKDVIVKDTFSAGLTFKEIQSITLDGTDIKDSISAAALVTTASGFTLTFDADAENGNNNYSLIEGGSKLVITYTGEVNENAVIGADGNNNTATLEYNNDPYNATHKEIDDTDVNVYTYGLKIKKVNAKDKSILPGAEFSVADSTGALIKFVAVTADNETKYRKATPEEIADANVTKYETNLVVPASGILVLEGLAEGTYTVTETKAPDGFVKLESSISITITAETDQQTGLLTGNVNDDDTAERPATDGYYEMQIENSDDVITLPVTGGIGTLLFSVIGILFMGLGAFLIKNILKKENVQ